MKVTYMVHLEKIIELIVEELNISSGESVVEIANDIGVFSPTGEIKYVGDSMFEVRKLYGSHRWEHWEQKICED